MNWYLNYVFSKTKEIKEEKGNVTEIDSSFIQSAEYDKSTKKLILRMKNGSQYVYENISPKRFKNFMNSDSKGKYFNEYIKPNYSVSK